MTERDLADRVRSHLDGRGAVREKSMFGGLSFMLDDAMLVAVRGQGSLLVRVDPARSGELLARDGAAQATMGTGRTMGPSWITVRAEALEAHEPLCFWLDVALDQHRRHQGMSSGGTAVPQYLIYFNQQWVGEHSEEWFRGRGPRARAVVAEMRDAGVHVFSGGLEEEDGPVYTADPRDGSVTVSDGRLVEPTEFLGGFAIVDVADDDAAKGWAARVAEACGWPHEVRRFKP